MIETDSVTVSQTHSAVGVILFHNFYHFDIQWREAREARDNRDIANISKPFTEEIFRGEW